MRVCSVGGNPVSAFLSWRLQATNACDVTLVWKSGFEHVSQYGISFKYVGIMNGPLVHTCSFLTSAIAGHKPLGMSVLNPGMVSYDNAPRHLRDAIMNQTHLLTLILLSQSSETQKMLPETETVLSITSSFV